MTGDLCSCGHPREEHLGGRGSCLIPGPSDSPLTETWGCCCDYFDPPADRPSRPRRAYSQDYPCTM